MYTLHSKLAGSTEQVHTLPTWILFFRLYFNPRGEGQALFRCWSCYAWVLGATCAVRRTRATRLSHTEPSQMICTGTEGMRPGARTRIASCIILLLFLVLGNCMARVLGRRRCGGCVAPTGNRARTKAAQIRAFCNAFANKHRSSLHGRKKCPKLCDANKFVSSFG